MRARILMDAVADDAHPAQDGLVRRDHSVRCRAAVGVAKATTSSPSGLRWGIVRIIRLLSSAALLTNTLPAAAQLPSPSAAALALGGSHTAGARGGSAVAWNPAGLGLESPSWSVLILPVRAGAGIAPITIGDVAQYEGAFLTDDIKLGWLERARDAGGERGDAVGDVTWLAASMGRFGLHLSSSVRVRSQLSPDAVELLLFGNAGLTGEPRTLTLDDSRLDGAATSTAAVAMAFPLRETPERRAAIGITVKYTVGHALVTGRDAGSSVQADPLELRLDFPVIRSDTSFGDARKGAGFGIDLGGAWQSERWSFGVALRNVVSTFEWNAEEMFYIPGEVFLGGESSGAEFEERPLAEAPADVRELLGEMEYAPSLSLGAALRHSELWSLSADVRHTFADDLTLQPRTAAGFGAEYRRWSSLPLRAGLSVDEDALRPSAGLGLGRGAFQMDAAVAFDAFGESTGWTGMLTIGVMGDRR